MRTIPLAALALACLSCAPEAHVVVVHAPERAPFGVERAIADLRDGLARMGKDRLRLSSTPTPVEACVPGEVHIEVRGVVTRVGEPPQAFRVVDERCAARGRVLRLEGGSHLSAQWAVYDLLGTLGVRFFHPEHTYYPPALAFPDDDLTKEERPAFQRRTVRAHRTHPVELSPPLEPSDDVDMAAYQRRWIDWGVKMRSTEIGGFDARLVGSYASDRGFARSAGFNLLNSQQGGRPLLDPDDPRSEREQIEEAIDEQMAPREGQPPVTDFSFQFNPSEFTEADHRLTVERLTIISDYLSAHWPDVRQWTINHGTAQAPGPLGVRFFDLPQFAPPALGVKVHTLMFYDLDRAAPVYGNEDFSHLLAWARREADVRRIEHYPESSWWLTFDLPVPLFLAPVTLEARQRDLDLLRSKLSTSEDDPRGIYGHRLFSSGQEWGYWLIDWCVAQMTWDLDFTHDDCLARFTGSLAAGDVVYDVWKRVEARQVEDLRDPELLRFLVGSDDETEIALAAGIDFHPLPPLPEEVLRYDDARARALVERSLEPLREMADDYALWAEEIGAVLPLQSAEQAPFVRELYDGLHVFSLRARHAAVVYETALALRAALADADLDAVNAAHTGVDQARALTERARAYVRRREADYRYPPELTIAGDEPGTEGAIPNLTVYPYRYLSRTHRMFYWTRPDDQLAALFGEGLDLVTPSHRVLPRASALEVRVLADEIASAQVSWGDGESSAQELTHAYGADGLYAWVLDATTSSGVVHHEDEVAVVAARHVFPKGSLEVEYPAGATVLNGLLPGLVLGPGDDGEPFLAVGRLDDEGELAAHGSLQRRPRRAIGSGHESGPAELAMHIATVGVVHVLGAVLTLDDSDPDAVRLRIEGEMRTQEVIDLLVGVGGFEPEGARELVADLLDYTPETLPEREALIVNATGRRTAP